MINILWYDEASEDLENIYHFYLTKNPNVAARIYNSILEETDILRTNPNIAAREPYLEDKEGVFRSLVTKNGLFKIVYYTEAETVVIVRIWCCRGDIKNLNV